MENSVYLLPMTAEMFHEYYKEYENDLDLYVDKCEYTPYTYDEERVNRYIHRQIDLRRKVFAIMFGDEMVGEIVIKNIVDGESATLSISMKNAKYKDKGFGTTAEQLAIKHVFYEMDIPVIYADSVVSNTRSQHVLEKVGFKLIKEEGGFKFYRIDRHN